MSRRLLPLAVALLVPLALVGASSSASTSTTYTPCQSVSLPTWSPDGNQIVYYGTRWPRPTGSGNPNSILQAYCTMNADGSNPQPLAHTVCNTNCQDAPGQLVWLRPDEILSLVDGGPIYRITPGSKPTKLTTINAESFALNAAKTRIASGANFSGCVTCSGPVSVFSLVSGRRIGLVGGSKYDNMNPSLSPDGKHVVFERYATNGSGKSFGLWTANSSGVHVRQFTKAGFNPLWSPTGDKIAYVTSGGALRLKSSTGGSSQILIAGGVIKVFGWSPDGKYIAFESGTTFGTLSVVDVTTVNSDALLFMKYAPTAEWAPNSLELVANYTTRTKCWSTYRVPADGSTPTKISSCN